MTDFLATAHDPGSRLAQVVHAIAIHRPELVRNAASQVQNSYAQEALLSGAPNQLVDRLARRRCETGDIERLESIAIVRTGYALAAVVELRGSVPDDH